MVRAVEDVVAGRFEEQVGRSDELAKLLGNRWRLWSDDHERCHGVFEPGPPEAELIRWEPWPRRARR